MDLAKYTEEIILSIVANKDAVAVKQFLLESEREIVLQVLVDQNDMSKVIGKNGKVINAIRTLVQASSYQKDNKMIKINVDSI